jgi:extracellular factor (EF) 3-hydroxypalmitic acid methyl ester biosynthesis protein
MHSNGHSNILVCSREIARFDDYLQKNQKTILQSSFVNLPLLMGHKSQIKPEFKDYTADLTYSLSVYRHLFDTMDSEFEDEPPEVKGLIQQAIINNEGADFIQYFENRLAELENLVANYSHEEHERHGFYFRRQVWSFILASAIMRRTNLKPRGYAGDSVMMQMIYKEDDRGHSTFSKLMHKHPIKHPAAQAVRNRRILISKTMQASRAHASQEGQEPFRVLSVACGPAFELFDLLKSPEDCDLYHFTLLDQDDSALEEAKSVVEKLARKFSKAIQVDYLEQSVRTMMSTRKVADKWGKFNFIYSMGLFDYLIPPVAKAVLRNLYGMLQPAGELIIGNFHDSNKSRRYMEYWNDWVLYYRSEEGFLALLEGLEPSNKAVLFEDTACQMFLKVKK